MCISSRATKRTLLKVVLRQLKIDPVNFHSFMELCISADIVLSTLNNHRSLSGAGHPNDAACAIALASQYAIMRMQVSLGPMIS
jgi:hypothetical protein